MLQAKDELANAQAQNPSRRSEGFSFVGPDSASPPVRFGAMSRLCQLVQWRTETGLGWLGMQDSNSETSSQIIPLKDRSNSRHPAEFWPQRLFAFELRRWETQLGPGAKISAGMLARTLANGTAKTAANFGAGLDAHKEQLYCGPVLRHPAELIQAANFKSATAF